jgi:hypothetical protein
MPGIVGNDNVNSNQNDNGNANDNTNNNANDNNNMNGNGVPKDGANEVILNSITFNTFQAFPVTDPAVVAAGTGTVTFSGGAAVSEGLLGLYADDSFSWVLPAPTISNIMYDGIDVVRLEAYWVHPDDQEFAATMTVAFSDGSETIRVSSAISARGEMAQPVGFIQPVEAPQGATIDSMRLEHDVRSPKNALAALDVLTLTVLDNAE